MTTHPPAFKPVAGNTGLEQVLATVWACLREGAAPGRSPYSIAQLATVSTDGSAKVRYVVLRRVSEDVREITFHTDVRSSKIAEINANPDVALVAADLEKNLQIRLEGRAHVITDGRVKRTAWDASRDHSLVLFRNPLVPGTPIDSPSDGQPTNQTVTRDDGYENFCMVVMSVTSVDWLDLSPDGHERAILVRNGLDWHGSWVAP
ncbi:pyridoxamine 5'-phosphate oxidase family protein [Anderseniella sp. Alg231-50]|uniref:pyridoxamine 5'-phosphate oxidase family protein n=1 Tax=Anderseniella sp. Alg231-50 TaxID=1922226 RepID=UPI000D55ECC6